MHRLPLRSLWAFPPSGSHERESSPPWSHERERSRSPLRVQPGTPPGPPPLTPPDVSPNVRFLVPMTPPDLLPPTPGTPESQ